MGVDEEHPAKDVVEDVAQDFEEVYQQADRLRAVLEAKLTRWAEAKEEGLRSWAGKLAGLRDRLERTLAEVDARTDEVAGRFPRRPPPTGPDA
ncbi:MAG: hypothetical protein KF878_01415 [Planctomycetes bacterium]|nr:hypothetical protein [Planctomycetota bacterium]